MEGKIVQEKYETFLDKYNGGVQKYVLVYRVRKSKHNWCRSIEDKRSSMEEVEEATYGE